VQYLSIGNEVNDYFVNHRDEIPAYESFFLAVKDSIQQEHPDVKVGMTFAYHDAERSNALDIIERLNQGDFLPVTLYLYSPPFEFDRDPYQLGGYLDQIISLAEAKPVALVEIGWSTAESLSGSEGDQEIFIREVFRLLSLKRDQIEFIAWFNLHDGDPEKTLESAISFIPPDNLNNYDEAFLRDFVDFLNFLGLREMDGTPKSGWFAFIEEAEQYLEEFQETD
jgi:hypothetical protein